MAEQQQLRARRHRLLERIEHRRRGFIDHQTLSHDAYVKFIEDDFLNGARINPKTDGRPDPRIQVSILPVRVLDLVWRDRVATPHPGDPIVADLDCSEANLPEGTLIRAGTAVLRVSAVFNEGCVKWKARYGADARAFIDAPGHPALRLRGVLCAVERDGVVMVTDRLQVIRDPAVAA